MGRLALGIDEGITSVGYGIIDLDTLEFVDYGVRLFEESTAANNKTRRTTRGHRRLISRKVTRLDDMKHLLKSSLNLRKLLLLVILFSEYTITIFVICFLK